MTRIASEFPNTLHSITGTCIDKGIVRLIQTGEEIAPRFFNSGVGLDHDLSGNEIRFETAGKYASHFFRQGQKFNPTLLYLPPRTLKQQPHCHPGGEIAFVVSGSYFDAGMSGNALRGTYEEGDVVFYGKGSTHRPLSHTGAGIFYIPFDGILFADTPSQLLDKMKAATCSDEALEYALHWMLPNKLERERIARE